MLLKELWCWRWREKDDFKVDLEGTVRMGKVRKTSSGEWLSGFSSEVEFEIILIKTRD